MHPAGLLTWVNTVKLHLVRGGRLIRAGRTGRGGKGGGADQGGAGGGPAGCELP